MPAADPSPLQIRTARDAAELLAPTFTDTARERLAVLYLDAKRLALGVSETRLGHEAAFELPLRPVIADALRLNAVGLILAHNHPSGDPEPSETDVAVTRKLAAIAAELGIELHDHLIFAGPHCRSLRALGLI